MRIVCIVLALTLASLGAQAQTAAPGFFAFVMLGEGSDGQPVPMVRSVAERTAAPPVFLNPIRNKRVGGRWEGRRGRREAVKSNKMFLFLFLFTFFFSFFERIHTRNKHQTRTL